MATISGSAHSGTLDRCSPDGTGGPAPGPNPSLCAHTRHTRPSGHMELDNPDARRYTAGLSHLGGARRAAGWSSQVAREAHNLEVGGSNPPPATFCGVGPGNPGPTRAHLR